MLDRIKVIAQNAIKIETENGKVIYFDPFQVGEYVNDADYIFITHSHYDHFSPNDIVRIKKDTTKIIVTSDLLDKSEEIGFSEDDVFVVIPNGEYQIDDIKFSTVPAYNVNKQFHKREYNWVGYIVNIDNQLIYVAGDTDNTLEAQNVKCNIAFVPVGGTYTMTYEEAVDLIEHINPKIAIPTHYKTIVGSEEDAKEFKHLLDGKVQVEIMM